MKWQVGELATDFYTPQSPILWSNRSDVASAKTPRKGLLQLLGDGSGRVSV